MAGDAETADRVAVARAVLDTAPGRPWVIIDADIQPPDAESLGATLRGGVTPAVTVRSESLRALMERLSRPPNGLPEDAVRRLGVVLIVRRDGAPDRPRRVTAAHYLRPTERDGQGHLQRRPPAVLATWDPAAGRFEHFAWGVASELGDRVDRSQADLERRQATRAAFLVELIWSSPVGSIAARLAAHVAAEPPREHAPDRSVARPAEPGTGPGSPHLH